MTNRTRSYSWDDTSTALEQAKQLSGLEYLHAIARGELPPAPVGMTLGMQPLRVEDFTEGQAKYKEANIAHFQESAENAPLPLLCTFFDTRAARLI